ncbi:MAG: biopolymer transporter ExbD [Sandaracinaceae bacterium]|nr:biopolymer transporter ExbD [Sandaracinaceae bacterium]
MAFEVSSPAKGKKKGRAKPDMNVTPLVDVVLVLLIIFMVITPLLAKQFWVHVPETPEAEAAPPPPDREAIVVSVDAEGQIHLNRDVVAIEDFETRLGRALAASGERTVFFDAASDAPYARAVEALDHCRGAGATTIAVATTALAD